jgi:hypothetical protein
MDSRLLGCPVTSASRAPNIPDDPERGEPGRCLPPEIMTVLCTNLDSLEPVEVKVATQIGIDTGRRPEDILTLPLDCLARDKDGGDVLVYDNAATTASAKIVAATPSTPSPHSASTATANRIWRDAHALLGSERARHAIGEVAVPYGTCTEPTNVQAGGGACPRPLSLRGL